MDVGVLTPPQKVMGRPFYPGNLGLRFEIILKSSIPEPP